MSRVDKKVRDANVSSLVCLLQLVSPLLPVGGYSYSRGLETAVEQRLVHDEGSAARWIGDGLKYIVARFEAPVCWRMYQAWLRDDVEDVSRWNEFFRAGCETLEFWAETLRMGKALAQLIKSLNVFATDEVSKLETLENVTFLAALSFAAQQWQVPPNDLIQGYMFSFLEHQVSVTVKLVPLGQTVGQRILNRIASEITTLTRSAMILEDEHISNFSLSAAIVSSEHETQYCRLFQS